MSQVHTHTYAPKNKMKQLFIIFIILVFVLIPTQCHLLISKRCDQLETRMSHLLDDSSRANNKQLCKIIVKSSKLHCSKHSKYWANKTTIKRSPEYANFNIFAIDINASFTKLIDTHNWNQFQFLTKQMIVPEDKKLV